MPFTKPEDRKKIDTFNEGAIATMLSNPVKHLHNVSVGDKCYYFYKKMMDKWAKERRWTTAHNIYQQMIENINDCYMFDEDTKRADELAWQVFFTLQVMPYELEKQAENGDIKGDE